MKRHVEPPRIVGTVARDVTSTTRRERMGYVSHPTTPEEMLRNAAEIEHATHRVALILDAADDSVREQPGSALIAALTMLPERRPLRRGKDQALIDAMRVLALELPVNHPHKNHILMRLSQASRHASPENWSAEVWRGEL